MDDWPLIFGEAQSILRAARPLSESVQQVIWFALRHPTMFEEKSYWDRAEVHDFQPAFAALTGWARQGFAALGPKSGWQFLLLDMGDCPETFRLYGPGGQELMSERKFEEVLAGQRIIGTSDLEDCFAPDEPDRFRKLFGLGRAELSDHHVSELDDRLLDWTGSEHSDFHGNSGYLLWLTLGSLALMEPLRDAAPCKAILQGRERLHLLSGYEEIFFHAATVTPEGIVHRAP